MKTVVTVVGARPQFIKAAPLSKTIVEQGRFRELLVHTGQHYDTNMSDVFFSELGIAPPSRYLGISGGNHGAMTGSMLAALEEVYLDIKPDAVVVYGDTNSTLAGALAASKLHIPLAHIEAGLRSFNRRMPEEQNRVLTDHLSDLLLIPSDSARVNLENEGIRGEKVAQVGDIMFDAALQFGAVAEATSTVLADNGLADKGYVLSTIHRAENTDDTARLFAIIDALDQVAGHLPVVLPLHPRTRAVLERAGRLPERVMLVPPVGYLDMVRLEAGAAVIATDSGGVQKEAYFQSIPCITLRDETEWVELIESGWNTLVPPRAADEIASAILAARGRRGQEVTPYGDGNASGKIEAALYGLLG